ncbi:protein njmu-r1 [Plakobranchus ocellatus]|uniref:Protein njmu-r1 n=1 Tax=Plakobranchus ocellatus TaxID=259542 RepID=A0AAV3YLA4_9GAST|nr:protein njmu-r1 [Plakobranchus ocellatus]
MESTSDPSSVHAHKDKDSSSNNSDSKTTDGKTAQETEENSETTKRYYALYSLHPQRVSPNAEDGQSQENTSSLSVIATNLTAGAETGLRKTIASWLAKDKAVPGKGKFTSIGLNLESDYSSSAICYSSVVELPASDSLGFDHITADASEDSSENRHQFVVSFVSFQDSSLDLFRCEFDQYVQGLIPLLDKELLLTCSDPSLSSDTDGFNNSASSDKTLNVLDLTQLSTDIQPYLEQWPTSVLGYLTRTLQYVGPDIEHLIYAALLNASLQISGASAEKEEDIKRFFRCCSLSTLMEQLQPDNASHRSVTGSSDSADLWQLQAPIVSLTFTDGDQQSEDNGNGNSNSKVVMDPAYSCTFCKNAADKLMTLDASNVTKIRDFLESIKLAFVHNLNKLKRFLIQSEVDYYALYRSLCYLRKCGCGELLVQYVKLDGGPETLSVLSALETFIKDMNQPLT